MRDKRYVLDRMREDGVVAVLRSKGAEEAEAVARSCAAGGVGLVEVTFSVPRAPDVIASIGDAMAGSDAVVGAGTVLDAASARMAICAGARFVVGPTFDAGVAEVCNLHAVPYVPGVMTVTEAVAAMRAGAEVVKLFPASEFSFGYIKALRGPLPQVEVMVTGGVSERNAAEWVAAGAVAVGAGGNLARVPEGERPVDGVYESVAEAARRLRAEVERGRS